MILTRTALALLALACASACRTTTTSTPPGLADAVVLRSHAVRAWSLEAGDEHVGYVVRFEEPGSSGRAWFSVRNTYAQELGIVDIEGRAWRYRPHQHDPEWLGSGTVQAGARRILSAGEHAEMREVPVGEVAHGSRGEVDSDADVDVSSDT